MLAKDGMTQSQLGGYKGEGNFLGGELGEYQGGGQHTTGGHLPGEGGKMSYGWDGISRHLVWSWTGTPPHLTFRLPEGCPRGGGGAGQVHEGGAVAEGHEGAEVPVRRGLPGGPRHRLALTEGERGARPPSFGKRYGLGWRERLDV